jgi:hypothetical protein
MLTIVIKKGQALSFFEELGLFLVQKILTSPGNIANK